MKRRTLVISDLHLGADNALLDKPFFIDRLIPELDWADTLVINGDWLELVLGSFAAAVDATRLLAAEVSRRVDKVVFVVGNHDHHLVAQTADIRRMEGILGLPDNSPFRVNTAEILMRHLFPDAEVFAAYPTTTVDGVYFIHGHYLTQHLSDPGLGWKLWESLQWRISGISRRENLEVADYEALITPLYELLYATAQLPQGHRAKDQSERLLTIAGAILSAPGRVTQQLVNVHQILMKKLRSPKEDVSQSLLDPPAHMTPSSITDAMATVCSNLGVPPGPVVFGHTHCMIENKLGAGDPWQFYNTGCWIANSDNVKRLTMEGGNWPGAVLRIEDGRFEMRNLLADLDVADLADLTA